MAHRTQRAKDEKRQGKSPRTSRGLASPGGSGTPPTEKHQGAGQQEPSQDRPRPDQTKEKS